MGRTWDGRRLPRELHRKSLIFVATNHSFQQSNRQQKLRLCLHLVSTLSPPYTSATPIFPLLPPTAACSAYHLTQYLCLRPDPAFPSHLSPHSAHPCRQSAIRLIDEEIMRSRANYGDVAFKSTLGFIREALARLPAC